ncbi:acyl-CoA-binding protein homolog [Cotesia glomerata]|uniref:ACB domain-containing protein n=1 Tax=Cotesia glomerata TaxID=32391 RepID=A0AAV7J2I4_COTGL|nr:acyl-CoA-binding protein homolog [Cotesia glomerata]KAH0566805.1 hypothetical protein KQX54_004426 [Cotesia glomerata]
MSLDQEFEQAAEYLKSLTKRPSKDEFLELYALFKQATIGDVNTDCPALFDLKGQAKWSRWNSKKGISKDKAKESYIAYTMGLLATYK